MGCRFCGYRQRRPCKFPCRCTRSSTRCWAIREVIAATPQPRGVHGHGPSPFSTTDSSAEADSTPLQHLGMAQRQITVSTVGVAGQIRNWRPCHERLGRNQFTLAVSLACPRPSACAKELIPTPNAYPNWPKTS